MWRHCFTVHYADSSVLCSVQAGVSLCRLTSSQLRRRCCTAAGHRNHWRAETSECAALTRVTELPRIAAPVRGNGPSGYYWTAALLRCGRVINYKLPQCSLNLTSTEIIKWGQQKLFCTLSAFKSTCLQWRFLKRENSVKWQRFLKKCSNS